MYMYEDAITGPKNRQVESRLRLKIEVEFGEAWSVGPSEASTGIW